jgi:hypothetical protein
MPDNPTDLLRLQAGLLNRLVNLEENHQKQIVDMLAFQEDHRRALNKIARAASLYFWLTVVSLVLGLLILLFNIGLILSLLRIAPIFR